MPGTVTLIQGYSKNSIVNDWLFNKLGNALPHTPKQLFFRKASILPVVPPIENLKFQTIWTYKYLVSNLLQCKEEG